MVAAIRREDERRLKSVSEKRGEMGGVTVEGGVEVKGADVLTEVVERGRGREVTKMGFEEGRKIGWVNGLPAGRVREGFITHV